MMLIAIPFLLFLFVLIILQFWRDYDYIQTSLELYEYEQDALLKQYVVLLTGIILAWIVNFVFDYPLLFFVFAYSSLLYVGISAIRNKVSILRGRGYKNPVQGNQAVITGFFIIGLILVHLIFLTASFMGALDIVAIN